MYEWITYLLQDFCISVPLPLKLHCDNQATVYITQNPVFHEITKHMKIDCHLVRKKFTYVLILPQHVDPEGQLVDMFTKSLIAPSFYWLTSKLGLFQLNQTPTRRWDVGIFSRCVYSGRKCNLVS